MDSITKYTDSDCTGLIEDLKNPPGCFVDLVVSPPRIYKKTNTEILKFVCNGEKLPGIYITVSRPYDLILKNLAEREVKVDNLFFIDLITKTGGCSPARTGKCRFVSSPGSITDPCIALDEVIYLNDNKKFLFPDTVSSLLIYNPAGTIKNFEIFLTKRMRSGNLKGILISIDEGEKEIIDFITQFCDKCMVAG